MSVWFILKLNSDNISINRLYYKDTRYIKEIIKKYIHFFPILVIIKNQYNTAITLTFIK